MAVYDRVVPNNALDSLWVLTSAAVTITVFDLVMKLLRSYLVKAPRARPTLRCPRTSSPMRFSCAPPAGHLRRVLANVVRDFESVREFASSATLNLLGDMPFMLFFLAVIAMIGGWMVAVPLLLIPSHWGYRGGFASRSPPNSHPICRKVRSARSPLRGHERPRHRQWAWAPTPGPGASGKC